MSLTKKKLDREIERISSHYLQNVQISVLDIPKIFKAAEQTYRDTSDLASVEATIAATIGSLRKN